MRVFLEDRIVSQGLIDKFDFAPAPDLERCSTVKNFGPDAQLVYLLRELMDRFWPARYSLRATEKHEVWWRHS